MEFNGAITAFLPSKADATRLADILGRPDYGAEDMHLTLTYLGGEFTPTSMIDRSRDAVQKMAKRMKPFTTNVSGVGYLGSDDAIVAIIQSEEIEATQRQLQPLAPPSKFPGFIPHVTLGYGGSVDSVYSMTPETITMSYLAVFAQGDRYVYALSG